ncbi:subtilisin-like protein [Mytilinidion resinicola]|uniref:tripeptidyl-peptidase II n=1 Tax=Mytilinidion resinicola TaxID=574789 RepID=A0A6A6YYI9_9PEZI|nr:subtilisin-like protein [Mytilinidion resinicola]KAF2813830.1 subtilisin-like protein [Mytilinidion resinicola]
MTILSSLLLLGFVSILGVQVSGLVLHESLPGVPAGWSVSDVPSDSSQMVLQVSLSQQNIDQLETKLAAVSTPGSPEYGQYLDADEVNALFGASNESSAAVESWLKASGVTQYVAQAGSYWFQADVGTANSMLGTTFKTYKDSTGKTKLRTTKYSIPEDLVGHVALVSPTTYFGNTKAMMPARAEDRKQLAKRATPPAECELSVTLDNETYVAFGPACLKTIYNINNYTADPSSGSEIAFGSFLNQSASYSDLFLFQGNFSIPEQNFSVILVNPEDGATAYPQPPLDANDGEANLDSQYISGISHPLPFSEYITAGSPPYFPDPVEPAGTPNENEPYLPYYEYLLTQPTLPQVITNSYGDEEQTVPETYAVQVCNLIGLLGLRGISVLHSSGDEGVGASCLSTDGSVAQFNPIFPATCPYVTSVGGLVSFTPEEAWVGSSGGFSNYFKRPWYQNKAVKAYLDKYISAETKSYYSAYTNFSGRGFPDVSAHSLHPDYIVYQGGEENLSGGTSAAAPVTASIIALLNDARLRAGKPALGFLNPFIYAYGYKAFTDITLGQSDGCNGNDTQTEEPIPGAGVIPGAHWNATPGWDPVTGYGAPNFGKLLHLVNGQYGW